MWYDTSVLEDLASSIFRVTLEAQPQPEQYCGGFSSTFFTESSFLFLGAAFKFTYKKAESPMLLFHVPYIIYIYLFL